MKTKRAKINRMLSPVMQNEELKTEIVESILYAKVQKDGDFYRFMFKHFYQAELLIYGELQLIKSVDGKVVRIDRVSSAFISAVDNLISQKKIKLLSNGRFLPGRNAYFPNFDESDKSIGYRFLIHDFEYQPDDI